MSSAAAIPVDSKSAKKRKTKTEAAPALGGAVTPPTEATDIHSNGTEPQNESQYIKDLTKYLHLPPA